MLQAFGATDTGRVRSTNQDRFAIDPAAGLCVIADGMGGHNAGEVAAETAVCVVVGFVHDRPAIGWPLGFDPQLSEAGNTLRTAIELANSTVLDRAGTSAAYSGMGTTVVAVLVTGGRLTVAHAGDSRLYRLRAGRLQPLTVDDSWVAKLMASDPAVDAAQIARHPMRHVLTNVVGTMPAAEVHVLEEPIEAGDVLLLTTDGVHGVLTDAQLEAMLLEGQPLADLAPNLIAAAIAAGSRDNCTAVVARFDAA